MLCLFPTDEWLFFVYMERIIDESQTPKPMKLGALAMEWD